MIYCSRNEDGILKADWIASLPIGATWVTRREKSKPVGANLSVCPGRGKFSIARGEVISCIPHVDWVKTMPDLFNGVYVNRIPWDCEAEQEGFHSVESWTQWYPAHKIDIEKTFRLEMKKVA